MINNNDEDSNTQKIIVEHRTGWYHVGEGAGCFLMCIGLAVLIYVCFYVGAC